MPKKPTETFGTLVFGKDGRVRPDIHRLPDDNKDDWESGVAERFIRLGSDYIGTGARFELLPEDDHDFRVFVGRKPLAIVQSTEFRFEEYTRVITNEEYRKEDRRAEEKWIGLGRGKWALVDYEASDNILIKKITHKTWRYTRPANTELWLLIWSLAPYPVVGDVFVAGERQTSVAVAKARELLKANGSGPFTRIFYFNLLTRPTLVWPVPP